MKFPFAPLPESLVLAKPIQHTTYDEAEYEKIIRDLEKQCRLIITRKRDGWKLLIVKYRNKVKIYTAGNNEVDERLQHIKDEVKERLPNGTVLVGEGIIDKNSNDDFPTLAAVMSPKKSTQEALRLQDKHGKVKFMILGVLWYDKEEFTMPFELTIDASKNLSSGAQFLLPLTVLWSISFERAKQFVKQRKWEGLVLYDKAYQLTYRLDSKAPKRPKGCYKWKPKLEDDFIVIDWLPQPGKPNEFKEVLLFQIDPKTNKQFYCGRLGSFTKEMKEFLMKKARYPLVMQIEFDERFNSGKLRNPRLGSAGIRIDKKLSECVAPKSFATKKKKK